MPDFNEIAVGQDLPELRQTVTAETLVRYAGASDDYVYLHWDKVRVLEEGFSDVVIHGWLTFAYICRAVTNWAPPEVADVKGFAVRYLRTTHPGEVTCGGKVVAKRNDGRELDFAMWAKDQAGQVATTATVTVAFA
jgi:acyl dehydratase